MLDRIEPVFKALAQMPERDSHPWELLARGIRNTWQSFFKPCRLIYRVGGKRVYVYMIVDGRREMQVKS